MFPSLNARRSISDSSCFLDEAGARSALSEYRLWPDRPVARHDRIILRWIVAVEGEVNGCAVGRARHRNRYDRCEVAAIWREHRRGDLLGITGDTHQKNPTQDLDSRLHAFIFSVRRSQSAHPNSKFAC